MGAHKACVDGSSQGVFCWEQLGRHDAGLVRLPVGGSETIAAPSSTNYRTRLGCCMHLTSPTLVLRTGKQLRGISSEAAINHPCLPAKHATARHN